MKQQHAMRSPMHLYRLIGVVLLYCIPLAPGQSKSPADDAARIAQAIADLGHENFEQREAATRLLWEWAHAAEPALRAAADSDDPEISQRAHKLLNQLSQGLRPNTSDQTHDLLRRYPLLDAGRKIEALLTLIEQEDAGPETVLRLIQSETTAPVRHLLARTIAEPVRVALTRGLSADDHAQIDTCLQLSLLTGEKDATRDYVAYHALNNTLPQALQELEASPASPQTWYTRALTHRAMADLDRALVAAKKSEDTDLVRALQEERGDWQALTETLQASPFPDDMEWLSYRAAYSRLAGQTNLYEESIQNIARHVTNNADDAWFAVEALLVNGLPEKAISLVSSMGLYDILARLLYQRKEYDRLLDTAERLQNADVQDADIQPLVEMAEIIRTGDAGLDEPAPLMPADNPARPRPKTHLQRADEAVKAGEFAAAIDLYHKFAKERPGYPLPMYLEGLTRKRVKADDPQADELISRATRLPLAHETLRASLAAGLSQRQFEAEAAHQWKLLWQFSPPDSPYRIDITPAVVADSLKQKQDYTWAVHELELSQLQLLRKSTTTTDVTEAVAVRAAIARYNALAAIQKNDIDTARLHIAAAQQILPNDIELVIGVFNALKSTEHAAIGRQLFESVFAELQTLCTRHPLMAVLHNETAWMAARCRIELEAGEALARRAVKLAPDHPEYLDTLAEILFQQHQREQAIQLMQQCIAAEPDFTYFHRQLKRFQTGKASTDPEE